MILPAEIVGDIPVFSTRLSRYLLATLNVWRGCRLTATAAAYVGTHYCTPDGAAHGREVLAASTTNVVTQNTTYDGDWHGVVVALLRHLPGLDPAALPYQIV